MRASLLLGTGLVAAASVGGGAWAAHRGDPAAPLKEGATPVIVELFSSEGCSSCPPAEGYLAQLDRSQSVDGVTVLALEEHVDYWDHLGWADPFAQGEFGERQHRYASVLADHGVYTPEIVIDGHALVEGGDEEQAARDMQASAREPRARVALVLHGSVVDVDVTGVTAAAEGDGAEVWLAVTESGLESHVESGENAGRRLTHAPVVRALRRLGTVTGDAFRTQTVVDAALAWKPRALRIVVFVQEATSRRIVGSAGV
jgi:hypothetical protein